MGPSGWLIRWKGVELQDQYNTFIYIYTFFFLFLSFTFYIFWFFIFCPLGSTPKHLSQTCKKIFEPSHFYKNIYLSQLYQVYFFYFLFFYFTLLPKGWCSRRALHPGGWLYGAILRTTKIDRAKFFRWDEKTGKRMIHK